MSSQSPIEMWQVEVSGQIYEADFAELGSWIGEGALHPGDKVRRGNLRWIEARRVPTLVPFFNAKEKGEPMPVVVNTTEAQEAELHLLLAEPLIEPSAAPTSADVPPQVFPSEPVEHSIAIPVEAQGIPDPDFCALHTDIPTIFLCDGCGSGFCKVCPNTYGTVRICPLCGAMCRSLKEVTLKRDESTRRTSAIQEGFGISDFFKALAHPFKFKTSLFFGAVMFMALSFGQSVTTLGGILMMVAAIFCLLLANMLTFGILSNTIESFAQGKLESNFMPSFDDFDLWDDVVHPFFLSIGAYAASFGPFFIVLIVGFYLIVSSVSSQMNAFQEDVEKIPGTHYYDTKRTVDQSELVKNVIGDAKEKQADRLAEIQALEEGGETVEQSADDEVESQSARETREQEELWAAAQSDRVKSLEAAVGKSPESEAREQRAIVQNFLSLAPPLVVIGAIFFLWGLFYFPAACAVAGYSRSFVATINPLVGLDTIKRLGFTYFGILLMGALLCVASLVVTFVASSVLFAFDLPGFGNLPAKAIGSLFGFYLWVVFSCVLGYAIFKKSDVLQIPT